MVQTDALTGGDTCSCGCLHKDRAAARLTARRKKQAPARVGQTNGHLRCDAYIGKRGDGNTARHSFHFTCLHCTAKVEGPWDNKVQTCGCMKSGGHSYKKVQATKYEKLVGQIVQGRRVDAYVGKTEGVHRYQLTCQDCGEKAVIRSSRIMKMKCPCRLRRTEEQEILRRMDRRLRARWDTDLKRSGLEKPNGSAFSWCGYTSQQLWAHIEAKFLPGMTRENRHLWHIDHIKPLKSAETLAEKKSCSRSVICSQCGHPTT